MIWRLCDAGAISWTEAERRDGELRRQRAALQSDAKRAREAAR